MLGWRSEIIDGQQKLTQLRLFEHAVQPEGDYGEKLVEQVRVDPWRVRDPPRGQEGRLPRTEEGTTTLMSSRLPWPIQPDGHPRITATAG